MTDTGTLNIKWAYQLISQLVTEGVCHAVISPGSRSTPLALACEKHKNLKTWVQIDERSAAFFALGLAQHKNLPVILICTSGSAVANWLPAVVEASHSYTPLLLLSADRPEELQNCGANQTMNQSQLFSDFVRETINFKHASDDLLNSHYPATMASHAFKQAQSKKPGPVHINIPIREPLLTDMKNFIFEDIAIPHIEPAINSLLNPDFLRSIDFDLLIEKITTGSGIIICGRLTASESSSIDACLPELAKKLSSPLLLDPLSNLRFSDQHKGCEILNYDHFLANNTLPDVDWIIRFGQFPVSKHLMHYLQNSDSFSILVNSFGDHLDPLHKTDLFINMTVEILCLNLLKLLDNHPAAALTKQTSAWFENEQISENKIQSVLDATDEIFEGHVINNVLKFIPDESLLFSGNSMAIRDFDTFITKHSINTNNLTFNANRGLSGIDGNVSSFLGYLASFKQYGVAVIGDLTLYHDMNGLLACRQLAAEGLSGCIIVINNSGGGIFNYLPQKQLDEFDKLWITNPEIDFQHCARMYDIDYQKITCKSDLKKDLTPCFTKPGFQLIEIVINQEISVKCHQKLNE